MAQNEGLTETNYESQDGWYKTGKDYVLFTNFSSASPLASWNSSVPMAISIPPFLVNFPCFRIACFIFTAADPRSTSSSSSSSIFRFLDPTFFLPPDLLVLFLVFVEFEAATLLGASRRAKALAKWPRCRFFTWKMCFSLDGWVA